MAGIYTDPFYDSKYQPVWMCDRGRNKREWIRHIQKHYSNGTDQQVSGSSANAEKPPFGISHLGVVGWASLVFIASVLIGGPLGTRIRDVVLHTSRRCVVPHLHLRTLLHLPIVVVDALVRRLPPRQELLVVYKRRLADDTLLPTHFWLHRLYLHHWLPAPFCSSWVSTAIAYATPLSRCGGKVAICLPSRLTALL